MTELKAVLKKEFEGRIDTLLGKIVVGMAVLSGIGAFTIGILVFYGVIMRYFFSVPIAWTIEFSEYLIFIDVMLATPYVLKIDQHVRVDIVTMYLNKKAKRAMVQLVSVLGILMCCMFFYFSLNATIEDIQSGTKLVRIMPVPRWIFTITYPIMSLLCVLVYIRKIIVFNRDKEMYSDNDYQVFEESLMDPRYNLRESLEVSSSAVAGQENKEKRGVSV